LSQFTSNDPQAKFLVTLAGSGKAFSVESSESVLEASKRAGLALPYSCLSGRCGSCAAKVLSGRWHYPKLPQSALNPREALDHALTCQAVPLSDMVLSLKDIEAVASQKVQQCDAVLVEKTQLAADVLRIMLLPKNKVGTKVTYLAGQYLEFILADGKRRPFSIACAPRADGLIELHVRKVAGGGFTQSLFEDGKIGDQFTLDLPHGTFVPRADSDRPLVFLAGGTGFAPIKALLEHYCAINPQRSLRLYWGVRETADLYLPAAIAQFKAQAPNFQFTPVLSEQVDFAMRYGSLHECLLQDLPDLQGVDVYMSGPPAMISSARPALLAAELPEDRLYYDSFDFAPDVLARIIHAQRALRNSA
jgi:CDP-4-dehydro-6-deoxyglucose reductase, E3